MKRFLRHELDRYLQGRALERKKELPLLRVEHQAYIHYNKASLVFYALADAIGEAAVNRALAGVAGQTRVSRPALPHLPGPAGRAEGGDPARAAAADRRSVREHHPVRKPGHRGPGPAAGGQERVHADAAERYEITLKLVARKLKADEQGNESEVPLDPEMERLEIGAIDKDGKALHLERRPLKAGEQTVTFAVSGKPARAGIDPLNKLIDRKPDDNLTTIEFAEPPPPR